MSSNLELKNQTFLGREKESFDDGPHVFVIRADTFFHENHCNCSYSR